ncbi:MAG: hypothetical protein Q8O76_01950 [Chloroflexota bacterium]|nr:hypothetical protein [Chloroflexota bacterium]
MNKLYSLISWIKSVLYGWRNRVKVEAPTEPEVPAPTPATPTTPDGKRPGKQKPIRTYISCSKCHQNVGQKGNSPARKIGENDYRHESCLAKSPV